MSIELKLFFFINLFFAIIIQYFDTFFYSNFLNQIIFFIIPLIWPGLAHGSLDILTAKRINLIKSKFSLIIFLVLYISIPLFFIKFWLNYSEIMFIIFLFLSSWHFGSSDSSLTNRSMKICEILLRGMIIIIIPLRFHYYETNQVFNFFFVNDQFIFLLFKMSEYFLYPIALLILFFLFYSIIKKSFFIFFEIMTLFFCFIYFKPLVSFFIYFCFLHSLRHLLNEKKKLKLNFNQLFIKTLPMTVIVILSICILVATLSLNNHINFNLYIKYFVIGISSLTVSHILLINYSKN